MEEGFYKSWVDTAKVAAATQATGAPEESADSLAWWTDANVKEESKLKVKDREVRSLLAPPQPCPFCPHCEQELFVLPRDGEGGVNAQSSR